MTQTSRRQWLLLAVLLALCFIAGLSLYAEFGHDFTKVLHEKGILDQIGIGRGYPLQFFLHKLDEALLPGLFSLTLLALAAWITLRPKRFAASFASNDALGRHTAEIAALPDREIGLSIALAAGLGLYAELMVIRLHSSYFQLFAYFKNISLLSCFLGLGIGYAQNARRALATPLVLPLLAIQILLMHALRYTPARVLLQNPVTEQLTLGIAQATAFTLAFVYLFLALIFFFNALAFIPLGQLASRLMTRKRNLVAYGWNLAGSLAGILVFTALAFLWTPPIVWILVMTVGLGIFLRKELRQLAVATVSATLVILVLAIPIHPEQIDLYSPYQILTLVLSKSEPPNLRTSNTYYQRVLDLRESKIADNPEMKEWADYYSLPYRFKPQPAEVLVVGSGTGNDVAAALRAGAGHVDAVEIDPAILQFGTNLHPESPYQSPKVAAIANDARAHIRRTQKHYDLIVYGLLDSHVLLSGKGGLRLDSYVYTTEAFREARRRLKPDGLLSLSFSVMRSEMGRKLYIMLEEAFDGTPPVVYKSAYDGGQTFLSGNNILKTPPAIPPHMEVMTGVYENRAVVADPSTDDWPFLYMSVRTYPVSYIAMLLVLFALSAFFMRRHMDGFATGFPGTAFFLGAGFMLVETKSITELALVYGSTWIVTSVVIAAILVMAFLANQLTLRGNNPPLSATYTFLLLSILAGYGATYLSLESLDPWIARVLIPTMLTLPLFFSGFAFSQELAREASPTSAIASNLLGAMLGGFLEYNSMYFGFRSLYLLALVVYGVAMVLALRGKSQRMRASA